MTTVLLLLLSLRLCFAVASDPPGRGFCNDLSCAPRAELLDTVVRLQENLQELKRTLETSLPISALELHPDNTTIGVRRKRSNGFDVCSGVKCKNGGTCKAQCNNKCNFVCNCPEDTFGKFCQYKLECKPDSCGDNAVCYIQKQKLRCKCLPGYTGRPKYGCKTTYHRACIDGEPQYTRFDKHLFRYQGQCPHIVAEPCFEKSVNISHWFSLRVRNEPRKSGSVSIIREMELHIYGNIIYIDGALYQMRFNGLIVSAPYYWPSKTNPRIVIEYSNKYIITVVDTGMHIHMEYWKLCIFLPAYYTDERRTCGLLGSIGSGPFLECKNGNGLRSVPLDPVNIMNANPSPNVWNCVETWTIDQFGYGLPQPINDQEQTRRWMIQMQNQLNEQWQQRQQNNQAQPRQQQPQLVRGQGGRRPVNIQQRPAAPAWAPIATDNICRHVITPVPTCDYAIPQQICGPILQAKQGQGVFGVCQGMGADELTQIYNRCLFDMCQTPEFKCRSLEVFADACLQRFPNAKLSTWRATLDCGIMCPAFSTYNPQRSACPNTCADPKAEEHCEKGTMEGCDCEDGYVQDNTVSNTTKCIPINQCGCTDKDGNCYPANMPYLSDDCSVIRRCRNGTMTITNTHCSHYSTCSIENGQAVCKCKENFAGNGTVCEPKNPCEQGNMCNHKTGNGVCVKDSVTGKSVCQCKRDFYGDDCEHYLPRRHCADLKRYWGKKKSGVYELYWHVNVGKYRAGDAIKVYCNMEQGGGGWTRISASNCDVFVDKCYQEYIEGFGFAKGKNQWIGLDFIKIMTNAVKSSLLALLKDCRGKQRQALYRQFSIGEYNKNFAIRLKEKVSDGTEGLITWDINKDGPEFQTADQDRANCSAKAQGTGWWFDTTRPDCGTANLNGAREKSCEGKKRSLYYDNENIAEATMLVRPSDWPEYDKIKPSFADIDWDKLRKAHPELYDGQ